ncbi:hypothetical protein KVG96_11765 [Pseudomonas sp. COR58]|uniref:Uncharacterized protein n=1 Tax=Pseudomonas ekonensis TaxID=2842353 RepID=A0ABS6PDS3_9PSED|nr:hypothetical protein [Pseudomonas ekonensis]MBV4458631.1 hypothetical protein [Pseudomonas ekonensis]
MEDTRSMRMMEDIESVYEDYYEGDEGEPIIMEECPSAENDSMEVLEDEFSIELGLGYPDKPEKFLESASSGAVAKCSYVARYHINRGQGAMKYQPVSCSRILNRKACEELRLRRGTPRLKFCFDMLLEPRCKAVNRKVMTVPSIGCPKLLSDVEFCKELLWAAHAEERPTFLVVHESEAKSYVKYLGEAMAQLGVGIVAWRSDQAIAGFGISRLAAQQAGLYYGERGMVVMSDVNVVNKGNLQNGYETDREKNYPFQSTFRYASMGSGAGTPSHQWNMQSASDGSGKQVGKMDVVKTEGGAKRPLEQVIIIGDELMYDPCFITSSEDSDVTDTFVAEENLSRRRGNVTHKTFRVKQKTIEKVSLGTEYWSNAYEKMRDEYLSTLTWEDEVKIEYQGEVVSVGKLSKEFEEEYGVPAVRIRSLMIEKILLKYKERAI